LGTVTPGIFASAARQKSRFSLSRTSISASAIFSPQERCLSGALRETGRVRNDELVQLRGSRNQIAARHQPSQTPARHAIRLGKRLYNHQRIVARGELQHRGRGRYYGTRGGWSGVIQTLVDFVSHEPQAMAAREFEQLPLLVDGRDPAQRVRGRGVEQHPRARRYCGGFERPKSIP
jgi:hypothetical protein